MKHQFKTALIAGVIGLMGIFATSPSEGAAKAPSEATQVPSELRGHIVVEEHVVRLGDLFTNVREGAEQPVAYAPEPGETATFDARWLFRVARGYKVNWRPLSASVSVTVERASVVVPREEIKAEIMFALAEQGVGDGEDLDIEFANRFEALYLPLGSSPMLNVENISYHARSGRFSAVIAADGAGKPGEKLRLQGRVFRTVDVPVLRNRVLRGNIIQENDIKWIKLKADRVNEDVLIHLDDMVGKTPKRGLRAGVVVRQQDVQRPLLVEKGSLVTIIHKIHNMMLTAQGKALQNGADGDVVRIKNVQSNQVIEAEIIGPGRVAVRTLSQQVSMNLN